MTRHNILKIATATGVLATLGAFVYAQGKFDKYTLKSPSGIAFSDFRGYEDWAVLSSARTEQELKVIVANPAMIQASKAGSPGNGQPFPEGSKIVKMQWKLKKSKRFPNTGGWGYAVFNHDVKTGTMTADAAKADCGHSCHMTVKSKDYVFHP